MNAKFVIFGLLLVALVVPQAAFAATTPDPISQANKFLAAETSRQIDEMQKEITTDLQEYQDANFLILDQRMTQVMEDTKWKVLLATLGAVLAGSALVAFFLIRSIQNYSFEKYQEKMLKQRPADDPGLIVNEQYDGYDPQQYEGVQQMQNNEWHPQQSQPTLSTQFGQQAASHMTQMNQWQMQPAYDGAWSSPNKPVQQMTPNPAGYYADQYEDQQYPPQQQPNEDPMASPGWNPQQGYQ